MRNLILSLAVLAGLAGVAVSFVETATAGQTCVTQRGPGGRIYTSCH